ncbi:hypothetical protein Q4543_10500 [Salipiger sp. 1_MG-2023]|uniref:hypothetical protein n=1 Tax=Salipiger sp. 1_MG-2023 TaxID=3062665 RepID=UPI0026E140D9|nr:hypothetical protein [Salipiger sp. 1_MG-2023]MDO6585950.1 hypothetical protein [Salipiger sp. 1_MG-2023]
MFFKFTAREDTARIGSHMLTRRKSLRTKLLQVTFVVVVSMLGVAAVTTSAALAQGANPMDEVAQTLNLKPSQLRDCLGEPPAPGQKPSDAEHTALVSCLKAENASLTADQIDAAMGQMRKAPPPKS